MVLKVLITCGVGAMLTIVVSAHASGPDWEEGSNGSGDAGSLPGNAQVPMGTAFTELSKITGQLTGVPSIGGTDFDFQDMYCIFISGPSFLSVSTSPDKGGGVSFPAHLWLFDAEGLGLLGTATSTFENASNDDSGIMITEQGFYYIAISSFGSQPFDQFENPLFNLSFEGEVSGPDGEGGLNDIAFWGGGEFEGTYELALDGISFAPAPGAVTLFALAAVIGGRRRRVG